MQACKRHPEVMARVEEWFKISKRSEWKFFEEVKRTFPDVDRVGHVLIFDLNDGFRLITRVSFRTKRIYFKAILNHKEYMRKEWMKWSS